MTDVEIVIKIPENVYKYIQKHSTGIQVEGWVLENAILNGTPLPKGHGRIIDESQIRHIMCHTEQDLFGVEIRYVKTTDAPTIIEGSESE